MGELSYILPLKYFLTYLGLSMSFNFSTALR